MNAGVSAPVFPNERASCMMEALQQIALEEPGLTAKENAKVRFAALVERQARFVFRVAYAIVRNRQDAEDVAQDTFLKLYRGGAWERMRDEKAFLARTAWRLAIDKLPKVHTGAPGTASPATPEEAAIASDWTAAVHRLMDALPEELRQPMALSTVEELSSPEIAAVMGIPEGTVRTRLLRARQVLKQKMAALMEARHEK